MFVHILLMTRGQHLLLFKVRAQRPWSHAKHLLNLVNKVYPIWLSIIKYFPLKFVFCNVCVALVWQGVNILLQSVDKIVEFQFAIFGGGGGSVCKQIHWTKQGNSWTSYRPQELSFFSYRFIYKSKLTPPPLLKHKCRFFLFLNSFWDTYYKLSVPE